MMQLLWGVLVMLAGAVAMIAINYALDLEPDTIMDFGKWIAANTIERVLT